MYITTLIEMVNPYVLYIILSILFLALWEFIYIKFIKDVMVFEIKTIFDLFVIKIISGILSVFIFMAVEGIITLILRLLEKPLILLGVVGFLIFIGINVAIGKRIVNGPKKKKKEKTY